ncbi:MAG: bifunctional folylpolyglutamate synthase/dihydrofolate synthase [Gemmatimonadetes bacterium]|nr:bifunctional folylpolyglutamate synthase/dihydrofolate synthase [Gemmatimonadota bacterium]
MTYAEACSALLARTPAAIEWSLEPTRRLLDRLGHPERHFPAIHIGGTNGQGSVCALVAAALRASRYRVGVYTSPHLVDVRERMMVDGKPIPRDAFAAWADRILPDVAESGGSFFEATTVIAFADFAARGVDIAVVEVGLGGRLDATNVLTPLAAAVTHIARDHTDYLGASLDGIAREKAGIAKPGRPLVIGETDPGLVAVLAEAATGAGAPVVTVPAAERYEGPLALVGAHQRRNAATARAVLAVLPGQWRVPPSAIQDGFANVTVPGRFDVRGKWIFDVAHNPSGVEALLSTLADVSPRRPLHALVGILGDKDWQRMLERLSTVVDRLWVTDPPSAPEARRWRIAEVKQALGARAEVVPDFDSALREVQLGAATVLVTGSFHTVGDALARLPGFAPLG